MTEKHVPKNDASSEAERMPYSFEARRDTSHRKLNDAREQLPALKHNLRMHEGDDRFDGLLLEFIMRHHLNITWYSDRLSKEHNRRRVFFVGGLILLLLIPGVVFLLSSEADSDGTLVTVQLTAVLTGLIAVHKTLQQLMTKRNLIAVFHKAAASLKKAVYNFETEWKGCTPTRNGGDEEEELFRLAIKDAIRRAREIEAEEEQQFFTITSNYPEIDLGRTLREAGEAAHGIVGRHAVHPAPAAPSNASTSPLRQRVDSLRTQLVEMESNLEVTSDDQQRIAIERSIGRTKEALRRAEQELLSKTMARLEEPL